jgi:hypothetical protein
MEYVSAGTYPEGENRFRRVGVGSLFEKEIIAASQRRSQDVECDSDQLY